MGTVLTIIHVVNCVFLIVVVLLQSSKGGGLAGAFGGGQTSNAVFGGRGAGTFLSKLTTGLAVLFMVTSLSLAYLGNLTDADAIFDADFEALEEVPAAEGAAAAEGEEASSSALEEIPLPSAQPEAGGEPGAEPSPE